MKKYQLIVLTLVLAYVGNAYIGVDRAGLTAAPAVSAAADNVTLQQAFEQRRSGLSVVGSGRVVRVLADDNQGARHQRFILSVNPQQTVLIAHNIDLAPRIERLAVGDEVSFSGQYEWNDQGGVIHWTHHDPQGRHPGGWLRHHGETYQ